MLRVLNRQAKEEEKNPPNLEHANDRPTLLPALWHPSPKQDFSLQGFGGEGCRIPWQEKEYPCIKALAGTGVEVGLYSAYV